MGKKGREKKKRQVVEMDYEEEVDTMGRGWRGGEGKKRGSKGKMKGRHEELR